jgi:uncharacterized membrane-anchored protein YhcB (DUF1043 family)
VDYLNSVWQIGIIALVAGAMIGALAYRLLAPSVKQADKAKSELDMARKELISYKASVDRHFDKTSELVNDLTQNYVKVYQHLAEGAQTLGNSRTLTNLLQQHQGKVLISVDDETNARDTIADDGLVDTTVAQEAPVEAVEEAVEEPAEPFAVTSNDETGPEITGDVTATTDSSKSAGSPDQHTEANQPVLDVDKIAEVVEKAGETASVAADSAVREPEHNPEVKPVTH